MSGILVSIAIEIIGLSVPVSRALRKGEGDAKVTRYKQITFVPRIGLQRGVSL